ncbi:MAG: flavodoxin family protein [Rhodothermales bacterium]
MNRLLLQTLALTLILLPPPNKRCQAQADSSDTGTDVLIAYYSQTGSTERLAHAVREGALRVPHTEVMLKRVHEVTREDLVTADAIILGSPTYYGTMAGPMKVFIDNWGFKYGIYLGDKVGGAFATGSGEAGGKEQVIVSLLLAMMNNGMIVVGPVYEDGPISYGNFGAGSTTGFGTEPVASEQGLDQARRLGERVARVTQHMHPGAN